MITDAVVMRRVRHSIFAAALTVGLFVNAAHFTESAAQSSSLDKQEQCAAIARRTLDEVKAEFEYTTDKRIDDTTVYIGEHESHYSSKIDKCFLFFSMSRLVKGVIPQSSTESYWIDAIERRYIAQFGIITWLDMNLGQATGKHVDQTYCELAPSGQKKIECSNRAEFDLFVAKYMDD
jgi:hypothetical protein